MKCKFFISNGIVVITIAIIIGMVFSCTTPTDSSSGRSSGGGGASSVASSTASSDSSSSDSSDSNSSVSSDSSSSDSSDSSSSISSDSSSSASSDSSSSTSSITPISVTIEQDIGQADPTNTSSINFTVIFAEAVTDFATGDVSFTGSTAGGTLLGTVTGSDTTYNVAVTGMTTNGTVVVSIPSGVAHTAGGASNEASTSIDNTVTWDVTSPGVSLTSSAPDPANVPYDITITFTEAIDPATFTAGDISFTAGTGSADTPTTSNNITWTSTISPTSQGTATVTINAAAVKDSAGNDNTAASLPLSITWDTAAPDVAITSTSTDPTSIYPIPVSISFSESVTGFTISDITVGGGSAGNFSGSGANYSVEITPTGAPDLNASVTVDINAGVCTDNAGNSNTAGVQLTRSFDGLKIDFTNDQDSSVVFGQPNFTSNASNQGGSVGANTYTQSFGNPAYGGGKLFLPDYGNNRVLVFYSIPTSNNANADYAIGQATLTSNTAGLSSTAINGPESVSTNGTKLIIVDYNNKRVLIYNTLPTFSGAAADVVVGQTDFTSNSGGVSATQNNGPESAFITSNKLFIADTYNNRVLIYNTIPASNGAAADLVLGQTDFTSNTNGTTQSKMYWPTDVWSDGTKVIVSDAYNHRLLIWNTFPVTNGQAADVVVGQANFTTGTSGTDANKFKRQWNFTVRADSNQLVVTDLDNHRLLIFNNIPTTNGASADWVLGQPDFTSSTAGCSQTALNWPCGVCILDSTRIMMIDANNNRALIFEGK